MYFSLVELNSFEQFCINYCNEKLQQLHIELVLKREQQLYREEGIPWVYIDYFNNKVICEMIDIHPEVSKSSCCMLTSGNIST